MSKESFLSSFWSFIKSRSFFKHFGLVVLFYLVVIFGTLFILDWSTNHGEKIEVPNIVGKNANDAKQILEEQGLKYQILDSIYDPKKPNGTVIEQTPGPTKKTSVYVKSGRIIGLRVSKKQKLVEVPNLINKSQRFASSILKNRGLNFVIRYKPVNEDASGTVVDQLYNGKKVVFGTMIPVGSTITIYVGEFVIEDPEKIPDLYGMTAADAIALLNELGFRHEYGCSGCLTKSDSLSAIVFSQSPEYSRGKEVSKSSLVTFNASMNLEVDEERMNRSKANQDAYIEEREKQKQKELEDAKKEDDDN
jgi:beta-lactam-binding protein with PASTA domain